jgi:hypothetical protein
VRADGCPKDSDFASGACSEQGMGCMYVYEIDSSKYLKVITCLDGTWQHRGAWDHGP